MESGVRCSRWVRSTHFQRSVLDIGVFAIPKMIGLEDLASWFIPILTIGMVIGVQLMFWLPTPKPITEPEPEIRRDADSKTTVSSTRDDEKKKMIPRTFDSADFHGGQDLQRLYHCSLFPT